jgi:hypothetical protein
MAHKVILDLAADVQRKEHITSMDNFFIFVGLFEELIVRQIYIYICDQYSEIKSDLVASSIEKYMRF